MPGENLALKETLVLAAFKNILKVQGQSRHGVPLNAWRVQNNAVFVRSTPLYGASVLELTETTMQFGNK